jgi:DNA-binding NarL/FixJ family response regulator
MRIVIAEDEPLLREGLALLLRAESLDVVATTSNAGDFLEAVDKHQPDVAIVDVRMPPTNTDDGIRAAVEARRRHPALAAREFPATPRYATRTPATARPRDEHPRRPRNPPQPSGGPAVSNT